MFGGGILETLLYLVFLVVVLYVWWRVMKYIFIKIFSKKSTETNDDVSKE